jgi:hypothetical protein
MSGELVPRVGVEIILRNYSVMHNSTDKPVLTGILLTSEKTIMLKIRPSHCAYDHQVNVHCS